MAKKIDPKNQTEELNMTRLRFLFRNKEDFDKLRELIDQDEKKRDEITTALASIDGKLRPDMKERWDFFYKHRNAPLTKELQEYIKKIEIPSAVNAVWRWVDYCMEIERQRLTVPVVPGISNQLSYYEERKTKAMDLYCRDAR
jgi:hypothetical protein